MKRLADAVASQIRAQARCAGVVVLLLEADGSADEAIRCSSALTPQAVCAHLRDLAERIERASLLPSGKTNAS